MFINKKQNPMVIGKKIKNAKEANYKPLVNLISTLVYFNNGPEICSHACSCCWDKPCPTDTIHQIAYLGKRCDIGHTSVLEHSNNVFFIDVPDEYADDIIEFCQANWYGKVICKHYTEYAGYAFIFKGSYRAIMNIHDVIENQSNYVLKNIVSNYGIFIPGRFFSKYIDDGILDKTILDMEYSAPENSNSIQGVDVDDKIYIENMDDINKIRNNIGNFCREPELFTDYDMLQLADITVLFKGMSRTCTHQLVRHRNAITQESQRYVDYSNAMFASPDDFKSIYDSSFVYEINGDNDFHIKGTLKEIGNALMTVYNTLRDSVLTDQHELLKEDARAYLPSNTKCAKIYMTFNFRNLLMFLKLREDKAAQAEIRSFAVSLGNWFRANANLTDEQLEHGLDPRYSVESKRIDTYVVNEGKPKISIEDYVAAIPELHDQNTSESGD